jgi:Na+-transporting NADH:ubiquinone oxidoreductase subunit D
VMGRAEGFAMSNNVKDSFIDGIGNGLGYTVVLLSIGLVRETLGSGKLFGFPLPILSDPNWYTPNGMLLISPSAFFLIGIFIWVLRTVYPEQQEKE